MGRKRQQDDLLHSFYISLTLEELVIVDRYTKLLNAQIGKEGFYDRNKAIRHTITSVLLPRIEAAEKVLRKKQEEKKVEEKQSET